ncbi:MAG: GreA/GreB family elongation factor [Candidatus Limnocylindria bacterium]
MSKAFTDEEAAEPPRVVPPRAPLPEGIPNYVTERGLALLHEELAALLALRSAAERAPEDTGRTQALAALAQRRADLEQRLASAERVPPPGGPSDTVRFGATVSVRGDAGLRRYRIVGVDEADASRGSVAFVSPLARALLGRAVGARVARRAPRGVEALEIVAVDYSAEPVPDEA